MKSLEALGYNQDTRGPMLIYIICTKFDRNTLRAWKKKTSKTEVSEVWELVKFLQ